MARSLFRAPVVLLSLVAAAGCDTRQTPCTDSCPDLSGVYAIEDTTPLGACPFSPYLLPPTVQLTQSDSGRKALLTVIDPSLQLELPLTGDVYAPAPDDKPELLGSFRGDTRTVRPASRSEDPLVTLDVSFSGTVSARDGRRVLSITLTTQDALSRQGCLTTLSATARSE